MIIKKSEVKDAAGDFRISGDFYDALDKAVAGLVKAAKKRADANGRKTLKASDL
jgi:histone H3/H4